MNIAYNIFTIKHVRPRCFPYERAGVEPDWPLGKVGKCPGPCAWISKHSSSGSLCFLAVHHA